MIPFVVTRWWLRTVLGPLRSHIVPVWMVGLLALVQLDAMSDLAAASRSARELPGWVAGLLLAGLVGLHALGERHAVRDLVLSDRHAVLRRQPVPGWAFGPGAVAVVGTLAFPVGFLGLLWYRSPGGMLLWTSLALLPSLLVGGRRWFAALGATAGAGLVAALGQALPFLQVPLALAIAAGSLPLCGEVAVRAAAGPGASPRPLSVRPRSAFGGMLHRDLLCLWRRERGLFWTSAGLAPLFGAVIAAMRINGRYEEAALTWGVVIGLAFAGPLVLGALGAAARHLGTQLDPPAWPVSAGRRALALAALGALTLAPSWAAAAVGGAPVLGPVGHLRIAVFVGAVATGAAWLVATRPSRPDHGLFPWWIALCLATSLPGWGQPLCAALGLAAFGLAARGLERRRWGR